MGETHQVDQCFHPQSRMRRAFRYNETEFGKIAPQGVYGLHTLPDQQIPGSESQCGGLIIFTTLISKTATVHLDADSLMPFTHSPKTGVIGFAPDRKPRHQSRVIEKNIPKFISEPILNLILKLVGGGINANVNSIAAKLQHINTP